MKKPVFAVFMAYVWSKTLLGLAISPYKSVREVTRHKVLLPVLLSPLYGLVILFVLGRLASFVLEVDGLAKLLIAIALSSALLSILLWQLLLLYLLFSFHRGLKQ